MDEMARELAELFFSANSEFIKKDKKLFLSKVSERTLCGALMIKLYELMK